MAKYHADPWDADTVQSFFHQRGLTHLRARKRGATVSVLSGPEGDPVRHVRFTRDTVQLWWLDVADHKGRWQRTPYRDSLRNLLQLVLRDFSWVLTPIDNPERSSDPEY